MSHVIYHGTPQLPYTFNYVPHGDDPVLLSFSGTAWTGNVDTMIGLELVIDGTVVAISSIFSNGPTTHRALHTALATYTFPFVIDTSTSVVSPVSITIRAVAGTNFDNNDFVTIAHV